MSEETKIHFIGDDKLHKADSMPDQFVNSEKGITKEIMDQYVDHILDVIEKETNKSKTDKRIYILDTLREDHLIQMFAIYNSLENIGAGNYYNSQTGDHITLEEMKKAIGAIRNAIIKKLADHLDPDDYYLILKDIQVKDSFSNYIFAVEGRADGISNETRVYRSNYTAKYGNDSNQAAFAKLTKIPPHENVINIYNQDPHTMATITEYAEELKNINELVLRIRTIRDIKKILMIVDDCIKGAIHLLEQGIVIMDVCIANIGYTEKENKTKGVLFDLEACALSNTKTKRLAHDGYFPPESIKMDTMDYTKKPDITEKEPVYQFGKVISKINSILLPDELKPEYKRKINELCDSTLEMDPKKRPTLAELHTQLEQIISLI